MLRVNVGLSRKLSKDYQSTGYSLNLDGEIVSPVSDAEAVVEEVKNLYDLAEEALAQQIERSQGAIAIASRDEGGSPNSYENANRRGNGSAGRQSTESGNTGGNGQRNGEPATNKQINYLLTIGKRQRLSTIELERRVEEILGQAVGLYDLTKQEAAVVIDSLTNSAGTARGRS